MSDKKKIVLTALITAVVTAFISVNLTSFVKDRIAIYLPSKDENKAFSNKMTAVENMLSSNYLYDFDKTKLRDDAIKAYVDGLDEPSTSTPISKTFIFPSAASTVEVLSTASSLFEPEKSIPIQTAATAIITASDIPST